MRIKPTNTASNIKKTKKAKKPVSSGTANFATHLAGFIGDSEASSGAEGSSVLTGVDSIYTVQNDEDAQNKEKKRRMVKYGEDILDKLEEIRDGILMGSISKQRLIDLAQMVRGRREKGGDPRLAAILDEIELRAEVELAKLSRR